MVEIPKEKFIFRPNAYGLIVKDGNVLVMKNKHSGKYWFPGGGVHAHETLQEGLVREILEETSIEITIINQLFSTETFFYYEPEDTAYRFSLSFFHCIPTSSFDPHPGSEPDPDLLACEWISINTLEPEQINDLTQSGELGEKICEHLKKLSS